MSSPSAIVLLLGDIEGVADVLALSENTRFEYIPKLDNKASGWTGDCSEVPKRPILSLEFGQNQYDPVGWILGSSDDTDRCDIQLAEDNSTGVSRRHMQIDISPTTHAPRLTALSRNPIRVSTSHNTLVIEHGKKLEIVGNLQVDLGKVKFRVWRPHLSRDEEREYRRLADNFSSEYLDALPRQPAAIESSGAATSNIRFGKDGRVYEMGGPAETRNGSFAFVAKVMEMHQQVVRAAKIPYYRMHDTPSECRRRWETLTTEFEKLYQLQCVSSLLIWGTTHDTDPYSRTLSKLSKSSQAN